MIADALTSPPPKVFTAKCAGCGVTTHAPVGIRWIPGSTPKGSPLYACPACAPALPQGPIPHEDFTHDSPPG